jgi:hypothetical protein
MRRTELEPLIVRWKKTTSALKLPDQRYGKYITDILEKRTDAELALFTDPVEAAAFFCLLEYVMNGSLGEIPLRYRPAGTPGQALLVPSECRK